MSPSSINTHTFTFTRIHLLSISPSYFLGDQTCAQLSPLPTTNSLNNITQVIHSQVHDIANSCSAQFNISSHYNSLSLTTLPLTHRPYH
ncbi:hypothetical protein LINPERHAP1_LOCUS19042, partial [Linum perenne]